MFGPMMIIKLAARVAANMLPGFCGPLIRYFAFIRNDELVYVLFVAV